MSEFKTSVLAPYHPSDEPRSFGGAMLRMGTQGQIRKLPCIPESIANSEGKSYPVFEVKLRPAFPEYSAIIRPSQKRKGQFAVFYHGEFLGRTRTKKDAVALVKLQHPKLYDIRFIFCERTGKKLAHRSDKWSAWNN